MKGTIITKRYAESFVFYAKETIGMERCIDEVKNLKRIIQDNPQFLYILLSPAVTNTEKCTFVGEILQDNFSPQLLQFLALIIEKKRTGLLVDMLDYIRITYSHGEATNAVLKSAYFLDLEVIEEIEKKLEHKLQRRLHFYLDLDSTLLGGVQVTIGTTVIDGSLKRRLEELRGKLKSVRMG
jgi:F-type H+-transporting ATPase subunit delta